MPCGPCQRAHAYEVRTRPTTAPAEPECVYDHPDLATEGQKGRIASLESEIAELRELLEAANAKLACCTCGATATVSKIILDFGGFSASTSDSGQHVSSPALNLPLEQSLGDPDSGVNEIIREAPFPNHASTSTLAGTFCLNSWGNSSSLPTPTISTFDSSSVLVGGIGSATLDVVPAAWPTNLPPPLVVYHLVETFFASVPLASRLIHKPTFMAALRLPPASLDFPHTGLLHAICGLGSLYSPIVGDLNLDRARANGSDGLLGPGFPSPPDHAHAEQRKRSLPKSLYDLKGVWNEGFGVAQMRLASECLRPSVREGDRLLQLLQATIICTWYMYSMGMTLGVYTWMGFVTRIIGPLGIYASDGFEPLSRLPPNMLFLCGKPKTPVEAETLRNAFWITYVMERVYNAGTAWPLAISDEDISQILPCRFSDFIKGEWVPTHNRHFTENMLLTHPTLTTDSWTLYIKASILLSRVRSFNSRYRISKASKNNAFSVISDDSPTESEEFRHLDQTIAAFTTTIPLGLRYPVGATVDPILYTVHLLPHVAMIQLHDPHAKPDSPNDHSALQMLAAIRAILDLIYRLCGTTYDLLYLDHSCSLGWFVAGAAIIRFLKAKIDAKDEDEATILEQELGIVKFMLRTLGDRTNIGHRQVNVLEDIYNAEIKGQRRKAATAPSATDQRAETDHLMFPNMQ